jgi:hypothetical protein
MKSDEDSPGRFCCVPTPSAKKEVLLLGMNQFLGSNIGGCGEPRRATFEIRDVHKPLSAPIRGCYVSIECAGKYYQSAGACAKHVKNVIRRAEALTVVHIAGLGHF